MSSHPTKPAGRALRKVGRDVPAVVEPASPVRPFLSFRSSYTELTAAGRSARVKARQASFENGRLVTESFDGELDRSVYDRMVHDAEHYFLAQTTQFLKAFAVFLPASSKSDQDLD